MIPERVPGDTVVTAIVPAAAYASDLGFIGAAVVNRYRYHPDAHPYVSLTELRTQASTKGLLEFRILYEQTETFGRSIRSRWVLLGERHPLDNYFGLGNRSAFDSERWEERYYNYGVMRGRMEWTGRKTVFRPESVEGFLDITGSTFIHYEMPDDDAEKLMGLDRPRGIDGGWTSMAGLGLIWENRDSEFAATRGNRLEVSGKWAPGLLIGDYPMTLLSGDVRQYITLPIPYFRPVLALRTAGSWTGGKVPYWKKPYLGDEETLRGYPLFRFRGKARVFYNIELRTWLYEYTPHQLRVGIHGFHDSGRVFQEEDGLQDLFRNHHRTFGGGVAFSAFTPDFILRFDTGFSDEMYRIYMNIGYMF